MQQSSSAATANELRVALAGTAYEWLIDLTDWKAVPRRSLLTAGLWILVAITAFPLVLVLATVVMMQLDWSAPVPSLLLDQYERLNLGLLSLVAGFWPALLATALAAFIVSHATRAAGHELSKYPEYALFGAKVPTLYLRRFQGENPEIPDSVVGNPLFHWFKITGTIWLILLVLDMTFLMLLPVAMTGPGLILYLSLSLSLSVWMGVEFLLMLRRIMRRFKDHTFENLLSGTTSRWGETICLSDPLKRKEGGEALRLHVLSEHWQDAVTQLDQASNIVFMSYTAGANLDWEAALVLARQAHPVIVHVPKLPNNWGDQVPTDASLEFTGARIPDWLRTRLAQAGNLGAKDHSRPGLLLLIKPDGSIAGRRVPTQWGIVRRSIISLITAGGLAPVSNPHGAPEKVGRLGLFHKLLKWGPLVSVVVATVAAMVLALMVTNIVPGVAVTDLLLPLVLNALVILIAIL